MIKLVIFDMDGLMFDTERVTYRAYMEVVRERELHSGFDDFIRYLGHNAADIQAMYRELFGPEIDAQALYAQVGAKISDITRREGVSVKPGLYELMDALKECGIPAAVASGSDHAVIEKNLERAGLSAAYEAVLSSKEVKRGKPYPDVFLAICDRVGVSPQEALVLEDSEAGVRAALAGGIPVINIPDLLEIPSELKEACVAVVRDLTEVIPYISGEITPTALSD